MAWTAPRTWTASEFVTASIFNTHVRDNLLETEAAKITAAGDLVRGAGATSLTRLAVTASSYLWVASGVPAWVAESDLLPWVVVVGGWLRSVANTNWSTQTAQPSDVAYYNGILVSSGAQNDEVSWDVLLPRGTWSLALAHQQFTNRGIYTVSLDGTTVATIDGYLNVVNPQYAVSSVTGISISATGKKRLKLKMATKNASSSAYYGTISHMTWLRTA